MPDLYDQGNNIDKAFEVATQSQQRIGQPPPDEVSFVMGFITCFGIITGRVDIGYAPDTSILTLLNNLDRDIQDFTRRVMANQRIQDGVRDAINGFEN